MNKITPDFDVGAIDDRKIRSNFFDKWDETRHLRIVYGDG